MRNAKKKVDMFLFSIKIMLTVNSNLKNCLPYLIFINYNKRLQTTYLFNHI